uniref:FHF complex subunit HOOK-interacting protein 1B n=1 Tax=Latimeria chalumnae TaxID=7897 RepID=H3A7R9_LATCH
MSWLSKLNPRASGSRASRNVTLQTSVTADPETCLMVFKNHWTQVMWILEKCDLKMDQVTADEASAVRNYTDQMMYLLAEDRASDEASMGPILEFVVSENVLERLLHWHLRREFTEEKKVEQLKRYEMLITQSHQPLLRHKPVLSPLLALLSRCSEPLSPVLENNLVLLLNQLCVSMAKEPSILELFFHTPAAADQGPTNLLIFSLLIPFIHKEGVIGQQARDALLLIMAMSAGNHTVARYITEDSFFCPVLATGLSALYSSLPRKIEVRGDDWHFLRREDWIGVPSLASFMNSLEFCNAVIQVAHPLIKVQLVDYVHNGFLVPVMGPALHKTSIEEMIASTAYLDLFLRSATETALLKAFLRFIILHRHESSTILDTLTSRIGSNSRLCMVSLSVFRTLLSLSCEDIMLQLVLRYLIPCNHVMLSQRRAVKDLDFYGKTADKFLSLVPECCRMENLPVAEREEEHAMWSKGHGSPSIDTSSVTTVPKPSTPSRLAFFIRQQNLGSDANNPPRSPGVPSPETPVGSPIHGGVVRLEEVSELESNYLDYLRDARMNIDRCVWACRLWSAAYDGEKPDPSTVCPVSAEDSSLKLNADHYGARRPIQGLPSAHPRLRSGSDNGDLEHKVNRQSAIVTPRTKKRGLQSEQVGQPMRAAPTQEGRGHSSSARASLAQQEGKDTSALLNGAHLEDPEASKVDPSQPGGPDGALVIKKVRRDPEGQHMLHLLMEGKSELVLQGREDGQASRKQRVMHQPSAQLLKGSDDKKGTPAATENGSTFAHSTAPHSCVGSEQAAVTVACLQRSKSVDSLIEELLDQAPAEANGAGINIETFTEELRELEDKMKNGGPSSGEEQEEGMARDPANALSNTNHESSAIGTDHGAQKPEGLSHVISSPTRTAGQPPGQPFTGPFVAVLFAKLETMLQNSLYVNLLLTGIVAQLACYPQPLLRSFLLNTNMVFQPSVKSLIQVLGSIKNKIEAFAASREDFSTKLLRARKYLIDRGKVDWSDSPNAAPALRRSETLVKSRKPSLGELILRHTNSPTRARQAAQLAFQHVREGQVLHALTGSSIFRSSAERQNEELRVKNAVYCAVVFTEFLKELAAIAQEHAVTSPYLLLETMEE